jgi:oxygen-independent coproporphyrinogen-3 oxidase
VYIGGGTPTALPENLLHTLLEAVTQLFPLSEAPEFTVEAGRPDSITPGKLNLLRRFGVNRIAVNPQTFNDRTLERIGRSHTSADCVQAYRMAREAGFTCVNMDIIAGLPGETASDMKHTIAQLIALAPENITVHTLAVKRSSRLNEHISEYGPVPQNANGIEAMLDMVREACAKGGYHPYYLYRQKNMAGLFENVGYSKPGYECLYNIGMMAETQTVLGVGAAAVSKFVDGDKIERVFNVKNPEIYIRRMEENL